MITRLLKSCKHSLLGSAVTFCLVMCLLILLIVIFTDGADGS